GYSVGDIVTVNGGDSKGNLTITSVSTAVFDLPGGDGDGDGQLDCEIDYDGDLDDDIRRPFDQNYNG
ncbi:MAG TPA: hypothetical protein D7H92_01500, partial [Candidatus Poseidoniales archaeon]